jgi:hypothetical protein
MSRAAKLVLVPTVQAYPEYASWWKARGIEHRTPGPPNVGIFIALGKELITGACLYVMDGPYCMLEHFSVNPKKLALWKPAAERTLREFRRTAVALSKFPVICVDRKSLAKVALQNGFGFSGARVLVAPMVSG